MYVVLAGIKEDDLCITKDVIFSALIKTNGDLDSHLLRTQLQRRHVDNDNISLLGQLSCGFAGDFKMYDVLHKLKNVDEILKIFYLCLRGTQDVCRGHQILADDLKLEARSESTTVC